MANTYSQIFIQIVFAVKQREALICTEWEGKLYGYITGIVKRNNHKMICINGMSDHIHMLISANPSQSISLLMKEVKQSSTLWLNKNKFSTSVFSWQSGYGVFSYSKSQLPAVIRYINNQKEHHKEYTFIDEYKELLTRFAVEFDEKYIFN